MESDLIQPPLLDEIKKYLNQIKNNEKVYLFVPYIKTKSLEKLIDGINNEIVIVTNWKKQNFRTGSAELSLYPFCNEKGIKLYNNEKIHLKVYSLNLDSMILATGNISQRGLMPNGNLELGTLIEKISHKDRQFFEQIIRDSQIIDEELYHSREKYLEENPPFKELIEPIAIEKDPKDEFLISALPMTRNIAILKNSYDKLSRNMPASNNEEINDCVDADLENYGIPLQLSPDEFEKLLKKKFFEHPFIQRIDKFLTPCGQFGEIKQWIQDNCTDVPIPSRRELTGNVQVLLEWFVKLGDGTYEMDVPGAHSQRLCKIIPEEVYKWAKSDFTQYHKVVIRILSEPGFSINEIEQKIGKSVHKPNDVNEENNRDKSIWHYKKELDQKVIEYLDLPYPITSQVHKGGRNKLEMDTKNIIEKLKKDGKLIVWYNTGSEGSGGTGDGIWRLKEISKQKNDLDTKLVLFSAAGDAAFEHFENTVLNDVSTSKFGNSKMKEFSNVRMWGANDRSTNQNRSKWSKLKKGDILLFFRDKKYVAKMVLEGTEDNYEIAKMIWGEKIDHKTMNVQSKKGETWQLIMYALPENATKIDVEHSDLNKLVGYKENFMPTRTLDFMPLIEWRLNDLERKYGSIQKALESIGI